MTRVICIGNRYYAADAAGARVYDHLAVIPSPMNVELIDGGLGGLDLLRFVEGAKRIIFVDAVMGMESGSTVVWTTEELEHQAPGAYGHGAGLAYLIAAARLTLAGPMPEILVLGVAPDPDDDAVRAAAALCLELAVGDSAATGGARS